MNTSLLNHLSFFSKFPFFNKPNTPYWVKLRTAQPECIYYFGPFDNPQEAKNNQHGYVEDLIEEQAAGISVEIQKCKPENLTIFSESGSR
ncbi:MAG: DUF1816 domain-containing protein [Cyanobacteria bacterium P01_D01_bin.50]